VIRLDIGSPDLPPVPHILEALQRSASQAGNHGYQAHNATAGLREAWAAYYLRTSQVKLDSKTEVLPLMGSKEGIFHLMLALIDPGDIVLIPDPGYITYTQGTQVSGGEPYYLKLDSAQGYLPDLASIPPQIARRARVLWLNYPNNPTAATAPLGFFQQAVDFAREYDLLVCHDAAYTQVTFDGYQAPSLLEAKGAREVGVEFNTLSKSHNMAGWRVGAALGNAGALQSLYKIKSNADSGHFLPILEAATQALNGDQSWLKQRNEEYRQRRDLVLSTLQEVGLQADKPQASIYVWARLPTGQDDTQFCATLLDKAYVCLTPGVVFGEHGKGYVRFALTASSGRIAEAMSRIQFVLDNHGG
jgi:LL-diaminopimelate aminotransferase